MPQGNPQPGERYLHFKDKMYEVTAVARHSETMEKYVVYRQMYGEHETFVRPYDMFISEVDRDKYPTVTQKFRFKYVEEERADREGSADSVTPLREDEEDSDAPEEINGKDTEAEPDTEAGTPWLDLILDAKTPEERYDIVCSIRGEITDSLIDNIATVLDLSISDGDMGERYRQLKECMQTISKYESDRFRQ